MGWVGGFDLRNGTMRREFMGHGTWDVGDGEVVSGT